MIPVMEIFGPTIQGEGMVIGQKTMFVRTGGCDYKCAWCDSKFTWDGSQKATMMEPEEVFKQLVLLAGENFSHVTISGGNPALIGESMSEFIDICHKLHRRVGLETQGSKWQNWFNKIDDLTISPKPPSSGMNTDFLILDTIISSLHNRLDDHQKFSLKIVVFNEGDLSYAKYVFNRYRNFAGVQKFIQVGNDDLREKDVEVLGNRLLDNLEWLFNKVLADPELNDVRPLPQLHTLIWGNKKGV